MLFTPHLKFLSSVYLSVALQSKLGCFTVGSPSLGPILIDFLTGSMPFSSGHSHDLFSKDHCLKSALWRHVFHVLSLPWLSLPCWDCLSLPSWIFFLLHLTPCNVTCLSEDNTIYWMTWNMWFLIYYVPNLTQHLWLSLMLIIEIHLKSFH